MRTSTYWRQKVYKLMSLQEFKKNKLVKKIVDCFTKFLEAKAEEADIESKFTINFKKYLKEQLKNPEFKKAVKELEDESEE